MDPSSGNIGATPALQDNAAETRFNQLEQTLENFQENARQMGVIASDFTTRSQEPLNQKIHTLISGLRELDHLKNQFMDVKIPLELLEYLDEGKNPQLYTKECLERTLNKNKEVNGKIEIYKKFRAVLLKELGEEMPNDTVLYRNLRDRKESSPNHENDVDDASD
uniref:Mediator of RNA polymerase II transcription subunit 10 n=1 Tax=Parascaris univalens TaxID=6257 RepID=A0A914ZQZ3_PARUN